MPDLHPGDAFLFRFHRKWNLWNRGYGGAKVVARDDDLGVVHLAILGQEPEEPRTFINHLPIMYARALEAYEDPIPSENPETRDTTHAWAEVDEWRQAVRRGEASAFDLPIGEALELVINTWQETLPGVQGPMRLASAYPVLGSRGSFSRVRLLVYKDP